MFLAYRNALLLAAGFLLISCGQKPHKGKPAENPAAADSGNPFEDRREPLPSNGQSLWDCPEYTGPDVPADTLETSNEK